jgi:hypothetical protein
MSLSALLQTVNDVAAVEGSYLWTSEGKILGSSLSDAYTEDTLSMVGRRTKTVLAAHSGLLGGATELYIRFSVKTLYAKQLPGALLIAFCGPRASRSSIRIAANLVGDQISAHLRAPEEPSTAPPVRPPSSLTKISAKPETAQLPPPKPLSKPAPKKAATRMGIWG